MLRWLIVINESKWRELQPCRAHSRIENPACMRDFEASLLNSVIALVGKYTSIVIPNLRRAKENPSAIGEHGSIKRNRNLAR